MKYRSIPLIAVGLSLGLAAATPAEAPPTGAPIAQAPDAPSDPAQESSDAPTVEEVFGTGASAPVAPVFGSPAASPQQVLSVEGDALEAGRKPALAKDGKHLKLTFRYLSDYEYTLPMPGEWETRPELRKQIPEEIAKLDERDVLVIGFMVPMEIDARGRVKSFTLVKDQMMCCFGVPPAMNDWVSVSMPEDGPVRYERDVPVAVYGKLKVGEEIEDGYVLNLYRIQARSATPLKDFTQKTREQL